MRKYKGLFVSISMASMLALGAMTGYAEETETAETETVEAVSEAQTADAPEITVSGDFELSEADQTSLAAYAEQSISMIASMTDEQVEEIINPSSILTIPQESIVVSVESWLTAREELGAFQSVTGHTIAVDKDVITIRTACAFENSEGTVTTTLDRDTLKMESMNFSGAAETMGTKMKEAGLNTLMGIGIVFMVLLFLSFLIAQFKHISKLENSAKKNAAPAPAPKPAAVAAPAPVVEETVDDGELIAVIAAAIAAAEGTSTDGFVVRSIKKSNRNKWQRA